MFAVQVYECTSCSAAGLCQGMRAEVGAPRAMTAECLSSPIKVSDQPLVAGKPYSVFLQEATQADCSEGGRTREQLCVIAK